jgi:hypothetical protein
MADHANIAAASCSRLQRDRQRPRCFVSEHLSSLRGDTRKYVTGGGGTGSMLRAFGQGSSQVAAEEVALAALNARRWHRYGGSPGRASADAVNSPDSRNAAMTIDQTYDRGGDFMCRTKLTLEEIEQLGHKVDQQHTVHTRDGQIFTGTLAELSGRIRAHEEHLARQEEEHKKGRTAEDHRIIDQCFGALERPARGN